MLFFLQDIPIDSSKSEVKFMGNTSVFDLFSFKPEIMEKSCSKVNADFSEGISLRKSMVSSAS